MKAWQTYNCAMRREHSLYIYWLLEGAKKLQNKSLQLFYSKISRIQLISNAARVYYTCVSILLWQSNMLCHTSTMGYIFMNKHQLQIRSKGTTMLLTLTYKLNPPHLVYKMSEDSGDNVCNAGTGPAMQLQPLFLQ